MRTINLAFALALLLSVASETEAWPAQWFLESCPAAFDIEAAKFAQAVRRARPGSPVYVPHPYPKTEHAVFANFVEQFREMSFDDEPERDLRALLDQQLIRYEVVEVAEWQMRCRPIRGTWDSPLPATPLPCRDRRGGRADDAPRERPPGNTELLGRWRADPVG